MTEVRGAGTDVSGAHPLEASAVCSRATDAVSRCADRLGRCLIALVVVVAVGCGASSDATRSCADDGVPDAVQGPEECTSGSTDPVLSSDAAGSSSLTTTATIASTTFDGEFDVVSPDRHPYTYHFSLDQPVAQIELGRPGVIEVTVINSGSVTIDNNLDDRPAPYPGAEIEWYLRRDQNCAGTFADTPEVVDAVPLESASRIDENFVCHMMTSLVEDASQPAEIPVGGQVTVPLTGRLFLPSVSEAAEPEIRQLADQFDGYFVVRAPDIGGTVCKRPSSFNPSDFVAVLDDSGAQLAEDRFSYRSDGSSDLLSENDQSNRECTFVDDYSWDADLDTRYPMP